MCFGATLSENSLFGLEVRLWQCTRSCVTTTDGETGCMPASAAGMYDIHEHGWGATVEWCIIATDLHCLTRGGVDVNKKTEKYLLNGSSAVEEIISSEETQSGLLWINEGWNHLIRETEKQSCSEV